MNVKPLVAAVALVTAATLGGGATLGVAAVVKSNSESSDPTKIHSSDGDCQPRGVGTLPEDAPSWLLYSKTTGEHIRLAPTTAIAVIITDDQWNTLGWCNNQPSE